MPNKNTAIAMSSVCLEGSVTVHALCVTNCLLNGTRLRWRCSQLCFFHFGLLLMLHSLALHSPTTSRMDTSKLKDSPLCYPLY